MAYTILNTDGTTLMLLADGQVDKSVTSLTLIGKNYSAYGEEINNNFIKLLANSANSSGSPPRSPLTGQLWYDSTIQRLKIYDNGFKTIGAVNISSSQPASLQTGDLWFDSTKNQLKIYSVGGVFNVGPAFPSTIGETGLILPATTITDQDGTAKDVILLKVYGSTVGLVHYDDSGANSSFDMDLTDLSTYAPNASTSTVVSGVTIIGDLKVEGKLSDDYLSLSIDLDVVSPSPNNDAIHFYTDDLGNTGTAVRFQNPAISRILDEVFPPNVTGLTTSTTSMPGILLGSQARVLCKFSEIASETSYGYQVRVFRTIGTQSTASWQPYYFTTATIVTGASTFYDVPVNYTNIRVI